MKNYFKDFSTLQIRTQIRILVGLFSLLLLLFSAVGSTIAINLILKDGFIRDGENIAGVLAERSKIGVLVGSPANAMQAVDSIAVFPDVKMAEVYEISGEVLVSHRFSDYVFDLELQAQLLQERAYMEYENLDMQSFLKTLRHAPNSWNLPDFLRSMPNR